MSNTPTSAGMSKIFSQKTNPKTKLPMTRIPDARQTQEAKKDQETLGKLQKGKQNQAVKQPQKAKQIAFLNELSEETPVETTIRVRVIKRWDDLLVGTSTRLGLAYLFADEKKVGLFLPRPVFNHGQLYVAVSRTTSKKGLKIIIETKDGEPENHTKNIVYDEIFEELQPGTNEGEPYI